MGDWTWMAGAWGWVFLFILVGGVGTLAVLGVRVLRGGLDNDRSSRVGADSDQRAIRILDERFARGDIDREEYTERRDHLSGRQ